MNENARKEGHMDKELDSCQKDGCTPNSAEAAVGPVSEDDVSKVPSSHQCSLAQWEILGKQFQDFKQSCPFLTTSQQREQLYGLLPLFHQVYEQTAGILSIPYIHHMASDLGGLLAVEMRKRISNKPPGAARLSLTSFLHGKEDVSGYLLLKSVYLLTQTDQGVLCCLIKTGLADVFLESLYLFLAFPPSQEVAAVIQESENLVQEMFLNTMLNLCGQAQGVEDLTKSSDFEYLFKAASSGWDRCDIRWSSAVEQLLKTVSKTLAPGILHYLHTLRCIPNFLQTLSLQVKALPPNVLCQVTVILLSFLSHSYTLSSSLLQDFENTQGYPLLLKILLRCEGDALVQEGGEKHLDELLKLLASLVICGKSEVKVSGQISHPQLPGFALGNSAGSGGTVKNLQAFQVLQSAFQSSVDARLCGKILSTMQSLWAQNHKNYFLLEWSLQPISQFVEILPLKPPPVHIQFFQLIRFVVSELSYIPHQTLQKMQELIRQNQNPTCTLAALNLLQSITSIDLLFSDLFRDSGLLGMLLTQLRNHAKTLRRAAAGCTNPSTDIECERELTIGRLQTVELLLQSSVRNAVVIKDYEMIPYIKVYLDDMGSRRGALHILEHLSAVDPNEYMSTIMGALCSSTQAEVTLKLDLLQSLQRILRSPREKSSFRNAAGFDVLLTLLSDMEGSLCEPPVGCWSDVQPVNILRLVHSTLSAMSVALHQDISNQKFVQVHGVFQRLTEELMQLGCFKPWTTENVLCSSLPEQPRTLRMLMTLRTEEIYPESLNHSFLILSFLLGMATGTLRKKAQSHYTKQITVEMPMTETNMVCDGHKRSENQLQDLVHGIFTDESERYPEEDLNTVVPGALCAVIGLIQSAYNKKNPELSKEMQCAVLEHILTLGQSERQRQVLCESQLLSCMVRLCKETLRNYQDPLRLPLVRLFEKLASQAVQPDVLRQFLCCGVTMKGGSEDKEYGDDPEIAANCSVSSTSIHHTSVSLVSMTSPRRFQTCTSSMSPSFVEFDMSTHGYGFLFLPSIGTILGSNVDEILSGGIGIGSRSFPPAGGVTFTCWFLVSKFCQLSDPHPLRFLTVIRHMSRSQQHYVCLSIALDTVQKCLVISAEEQEFQPLDMMEVELSPNSPPHPPSQVRVRLFGRITIGQWHHLSVVLKEVKRSCRVSVAIDGEVLAAAEMRYIQRFPGCSSSLEPNSLVDIHAFIGTPKMWCQQSPLLWRISHAYLFEDVLSEDTLFLMQRLGPSYCGTFRNGDISSLLVEEKIIFGVNALSSYLTTITEIKDTFNDVDGRHVAKEVGLTSRDNYKPVFLARNLASHLLGATRSLGAVAVEGKGVRVFHSSPASNALNYIGGPAVILSLISMANDDHALYASIKALVSVLSIGAMAEQLMEHINGYRLWLEAPEDLDVSLLVHLEDFLRCPRDTEMTQQLQLVDRLVFLLNDSRITSAKITIICKLLSYCLQYSFNLSNILRLGLLLVSTLTAASVDEMQLYPRDPSLEDTYIDSGRMIWLRNHLLGILIELMCHPSCFSEEQQGDLLVTLGADWFLLFVQPSVHTSSVALGMRLIGHILQVQTLQNRFKEVARAGAYVENTSNVQILTDNLRGPRRTPVCSSPLLSGFAVLRETICCHIDKPEIYLLLSSTFLCSCLPEGPSEADMDTSLQNLFQNHNRENILQNGLCVEAAVLLLIMVKASICQETSAANKCKVLISSTSVIQFFCLIYHNYPCDPLWITSDFINLLANLLMQRFHLEPCAADGEEAQDQAARKQHEHSQSVRKTIQELMHLILKESLTYFPTQKQDHPFEYLLETLPADGNNGHMNQFQTEILQCAMEMFHSMSQKGETQNLEQLGADDCPRGLKALEATTIANLSYFSQKLLEKMLCGAFLADPCEILIFFIKQISTVTHTTSACNRESLFTMLYGCLNRSILYCLAKPRNTQKEMLSLFKVLELLLAQWDVIFTTYNSSIVFTTCLMHCLFQIYTGSSPEGFGVKAKSQRNSWQLIFLTKDEEEIEQMTMGSDPQEVHMQVLQSVQTVWEQLMFNRRQMLEEHYKMDLSVRQGEMLISQVTPLWEERASTAWQQYLASEKKNLKSKRRTSAGPGHRMAAAVRGLYSANDQEVDFKLQDVAAVLENCRTAGLELFKWLYREHQQMQKCDSMAAGKDWLALEEELFSQGGVWGSICSESDQRWELSRHEGPWRVRKRMQRVPQKLQTSTSVEQAIRLSRMTNPGGLLKQNKNESVKTGLTFFPTLQESSCQKDRCPETLFILQEFQKNEKITSKMSIALVEGHLLMEGVLLFGKDHFYLCPHFTVSSSGEVACSKHSVSSIQDPFIYDLCYKNKFTISSSRADENLKHMDGSLASPGKEEEPVSFWVECYSYQEVMELKTRHFLMQEMALEIFFVNKITKFLVFHNKDMIAAMKWFQSTMPSVKGKAIVEDPHHTM
uniref:WDFY family member 4 n=1 Tax=Leptobrachium leishanense TaxID=445787 RepID=A0A8C5QK71_9ANUR